MSRRIHVVDMRGIGWIPYYHYTSELIGSYSNYSSEDSLNGLVSRFMACKLLFFSGNEPPPQENILLEHSRFVEFLNTKNYRGAIALYNIELYHSDNDEYDLSFETLPIKDCVGYTPYRISRSGVLKYAKGDGWEREPTIEYHSDGISIEHISAFRIGKWGRNLAQALTGYEPPFAWMRVRYYIKHTGEYSVTFSGTSIPSQRHYINTQHQNGINVRLRRQCARTEETCVSIGRVKKEKKN